MSAPPDHQAFADQVAASKLQDPMGTFANLSAATGIPVEDLVHYALVRWAAAGSEMLMATPPLVLQQLVEARRREDWATVGGLIDWLASGG
ncbi:MAG TPA: DUF6027 family protein [Solirubrobacterales bacterium]|nr:DUF6027 family protein [Solirubrobacterales bacterium]